MTPNEAFFQLHAGLAREGPGCREDLDWAVEFATLPEDACILDAGCGPGADIERLLTHMPKGHVTAVDKHLPFIEAVNARWSSDARVTAIAGDMADAEGPFDLVWCAGALYFLSVDKGLPLLGKKLAPGGAIAFSDLVYLNSNPDLALRDYLEAEVPQMRSAAELGHAIAKAGFHALGQRVLSDEAWEEYFTPMEQRIDMLRSNPDAALTEVLDEADTEIAMWRRYSHQFGYVLSVVRPT